MPNSSVGKASDRSRHRVPDTATFDKNWENVI